MHPFRFTSSNYTSQTRFRCCCCCLYWEAITSCPHYAVLLPLARYVKLRVAHAQGMPGTFSLPPLVSGPDIHHGTCVTHVPWCMLWWLTSGFLWSRWRGKRSRHFRRMRNPQCCVSGKKPNDCLLVVWWHKCHVICLSQWEKTSHLRCLYSDIKTLFGDKYSTGTCSVD